MFRHKGKNRTIKHNLRIAILLSFVAGMVNVTGFLAVQQLTTNVTGHFAFFVEEIYSLNTWRGLVYFLFVFFFFLGSFISGLLIELMSKKNERFIYIIPVLIEISILFIVGIFGQYFLDKSPNAIAYLLLFAMGLQNSLVTMISNSVVRTTHLTGLFTDLGIEFSQLIFYFKSKEHKQKLIQSIKLRAAIILFFFLGGILSALVYSKLDFKILLIAGMILLFGLIYDQIRLRVNRIRRKMSHKKIRQDNPTGS